MRPVAAEMSALHTAAVFRRSMGGSLIQKFGLRSERFRFANKRVPFQALEDVDLGMKPLCGWSGATSSLD